MYTHAAQSDVLLERLIKQLLRQIAWALSVIMWPGLIRKTHRAVMQTSCLVSLQVSHQVVTHKSCPAPPLHLCM